MRIKFNDKIYRLKEIESGVDSLMELVEEPKYKHGDFLMTYDRIAFIFDRDGKNGEAHYLFAADMDGTLCDDIQERGTGTRYCGYLKDAVLADQEATEAIHGCLKFIGKRWNDDKKCIEDIPQRKFKAGDKVTLKSGCTSKPGITYCSLFDEYIGRELKVIRYTLNGYVYCGNGYYFHEDWLEPWSDEPKVGGWVIYWDYIKEIAHAGVLTGISTAGKHKYIVDNGSGWKHAVKWNGTKEHLERIRSGKV